MTELFDKELDSVSAGSNESSGAKFHDKDCVYYTTGTGQTRFRVIGEGVLVDGEYQYRIQRLTKCTTFKNNIPESQLSPAPSKASDDQVPYNSFH